MIEFISDEVSQAAVSDEVVETAISDEVVKNPSDGGARKP